MALEAERICFFCAQQVLVVAAVRLMAGCASLPKSRLVQVCLLELLGLIGMAGQAGAHRVRLEEAWSLAGVGVVAGDAFSLRSGMRHLGLINLLDLVAVAGRTKGSRIGVC